jgi:hypothetical protein
MRPALTSHFQCWFQPPTDVKNWVNARGFNYDSPGNSELISLSCSEASLPGSSFATNEINDDHTGVTERYAYRRQYDDRSDFTFYVDHARKEGSYNVIWFFENWMSYIVDEQYNSINRPSLDNENYFYRIRFPEQYQSDIYINKFEKDFQGSYLQYKFKQAYPISINSIPVSYESSQLLKCTVSFTYTRYLVQRVPISFTSPSPIPQPPSPVPPPGPLYQTPTPSPSPTANPNQSTRQRR